MTPALELVGVSKDYRALRPLRIRELTVAEGESIAIGGLDAAASEVLTNLATGSTLPDEGVVRVFGKDTRAITSAEEWLASLDRFGIVSDRVALVEAFTLRQNIAIALTLELDPLPPQTSAAVDSLAREAGLPRELLDVAAASAAPAARFRARVARAIALDPRVLLVEHPTGSLPRPDVRSVASDFFRVAHARTLASLVMSADRDFVRAADRRLELQPATGVLRRQGLRAWFP